MINGKTRSTLQNCLTAVKQKTDATYLADKPVTVHFFQSMQARVAAATPM